MYFLYNIFLDVHPLKSLHLFQYAPHSALKKDNRAYHLSLRSMRFLLNKKAAVRVGSELTLASYPLIYTPPFIAITFNEALESVNSLASASNFNW